MRRASFVLAALLLTAACGSMGDLGGTLGDILGSPSQSQPSDVRGVVTSVNQSNQSIDIEVGYINNLRNTNANNQRGTIYFDNRTRVVYNGRDFSVNDLERGDEISVRGANVNGRYVAEVIEVTRDVSG
jgi:hypothetical protein